MIQQKKVVNQASVFWKIENKLFSLTLGHLPGNRVPTSLRGAYLTVEYLPQCGPATWQWGTILGMGLLTHWGAPDSLGGT